MRFEITLSLSKKDALLPYNYQYELSSWIYKVFKEADPSYATFLHDIGYQRNEKKTFKLFSFSNFFISKFESLKEGIKILTDEISFKIGFYHEKATENFITGLFKSQKGSIGNKQLQIDFEVKKVTSIPIDICEEKIQLRTLSPLVIGKKNEKNMLDYLSPQDTDFQWLFMNNLLEKYQTTKQTVPKEWQNFPFSLRLLEDNVKSKLITIKSDTDKQTQVKGFLFKFELIAPKELIKIALLAGMGLQNANGFGFCEVIR